MFDTLMLCWTTSASSSHFLASIFLWLESPGPVSWSEKCQDTLKQILYRIHCHINWIACISWWGCKRTILLQNPCWPCRRTVGWVDGSFGLIEWLPLNWWQNPVIKWEPISESLSTLQFGGCARIWEPCKCRGSSSWQFAPELQKYNLIPEMSFRNLSVIRHSKAWHSLAKNAMSPLQPNKDDVLTFEDRLSDLYCIWCSR